MSARRIMLIDDNKIDLFIHSEVIKRMPFEKLVQQYSFAGDALNFLQQNAIEHWPDVILLDIYMPVINGFDFLEQFSVLPDLSRSKCRVVVVSSSLDAGDLKKAKGSKYVYDFLEKPLDMDKLFKVLNSSS